jgi:PLP dependent protein
MIKDNLSKVKLRISSVCSKLGVSGEYPTIVAVSKGRDIAEILEVIEAGLTDIGENKIQEALLKYRQFQALGPRFPSVKWHMVGHLQTNKVKDAVKIFDLIHSVDSVRLASEIDKQAAKINKTQDILIEIKTSSEATKFGVKPDDTVGFVKEINKLNNINIRGLMTIAPPFDKLEETSPYFRTLRLLRDEMNLLHATRRMLNILSMGMTDDFEAAIAEGSNMVRLGRVIFGC